VLRLERARRGELAPAAGPLLADLGAVRALASGSGYEHVERLSDDVVRAYVEPIFGTLERGRALERLLVSLQASDLLAVEPRLRQLQVPTLVVWGTGDATFDLHWASWLRDTVPAVTEVVELPDTKLFFPTNAPPTCCLTYAATGPPTHPQRPHHLQHRRQ